MANLAHPQIEGNLTSPSLFPPGTEQDNPTPDDPIPKVFSYFCEQAGKTKHYRLTAKRLRMARKRWNEEVKAEITDNTPREQIRRVVGMRFKHVIDELCDSKFHRDGGYLEWEQIFNSEDRFTKWVDRYENGYSQRKDAR